MNYNEHEIMNAFRIYSSLSLSGSCDLYEHDSFFVNDKIRGLVEHFCLEVNCAVLVTNNRLLMIPLIMNSPFHISNERLKNDYLSKNALNSDIYLMYFSIIVFYGLFYDSYNTTEPVRDFLKVETWLDHINQHVESLSEHDEDILKSVEKDMQYNWLTIIEKWHAIDDTNERALKQDGRTNSRLSFLNSVKKFMIEQELIEDIGNMELVLTEKSKDIVMKYYMDSDYNREILEFLYMSGGLNGDDF